jgi:hypothetical protein
MIVKRSAPATNNWSAAVAHCGNQDTDRMTERSESQKQMHHKLRGTHEIRLSELAVSLSSAWDSRAAGFA